jgi:ATP-dependent DNA ligase
LSRCFLLPLPLPLPLQVAVFSRNCEDRTASFSAEAHAVLAAADPAALPLVIDAELVAVDRANGNRVRAFQELATRPRGSAAAAAGGGSAVSPSTKQQPGKQQQQRKQQQQLSFGAAAAPSKQASSAAELSAEEAVLLPSQPQQQQQQASSSGAVDICVFAFDALCIGGRDLMGLSLRERRAALAAALPGITPGVVQMAEGVEIQLQLPLQGVVVTQQAAAAEGEADAAEQAAAAAAAAAVVAAGSGVGAAAAGSRSAEESATEFFFSALAAGSEGLMMKLLDGPGAALRHKTVI